MEKIKHFLDSEKGKDILVVLIVILVGIGSFELGRLSKESGSGGIKIQYPSQNTIQGTDQTGNVVFATNKVSSIDTSENFSAGKNFFASSRGSKYYTISCSAGKTIKQENRIWFTTGEEAEQSGYTLSSGCN